MSQPTVTQLEVEAARTRAQVAHTADLLRAKTDVRTRLREQAPRLLAVAGGVLAVTALLVVVRHRRR